MAPLLISTPAPAPGVVRAGVPAHSYPHAAASTTTATSTLGTPPYGPTTATSRLMNHHCCIPTAATTDPAAAGATAPTTAAGATCRSCPGGVELRPLEGEALGCEVVGLDLMAGPISPQLIDALRQALLRHQVRCVPCLALGRGSVEVMLRCSLELLRRVLGSWARTARGPDRSGGMVTDARHTCM